MTFSTLKTDILGLIGREPAAVVYRLVTADINASLRLSIMQNTATLVEAASVALPSDFLEVIDLYRDTNPRVALAPSTTTGQNTRHNTSGVPQTYAIVDGALILNPEPNGSENLELRYYAKLADLVLNDDTNPVLEKYPGVYLYGALAHHATIIRDEKAAAMWKAAFGEQMRQARGSDAIAMASGGPRVPTVRSVA